MLVKDRFQAMRDERGQMAVELAVVMPVILIVLVITVDAFVFMSECARFDHLVPQHVLSCATSASRDGNEGESRSSAIQELLDDEFARRGSTVEVKCSDAGVPLSNVTTYACTFKFVPWPFSGAGSPATLKHTCTLTVDPYTPGELL